MHTIQCRDRFPRVGPRFSDGRSSAVLVLCGTGCTTSQAPHFPRAFPRLHDGGAGSGRVCWHHVILGEKGALFGRLFGSAIERKFSDQRFATFTLGLPRMEETRAICGVNTWNEQESPASMRTEDSVYIFHV